MEELDKAGKAVDDVNDLFTTIKSKVEVAMSCMRNLGVAEARKAAEVERILYAMEVILDMQDRLEKPAVILKELKDKLSDLAPF